MSAWTIPTLLVAVMVTVLLLGLLRAICQDVTAWLRGDR